MFHTYDTLNNVVQGEFIRHPRGQIVCAGGLRKAEVWQDLSIHLRRLPQAEKTLPSSPLMQLSVYGCMLLISWFGRAWWWDQSMTTGQLTSMFTYVMQILSSLMMLSMVSVLITIAALLRRKDRRGARGKSRI